MRFEELRACFWVQTHCGRRGVRCWIRCQLRSWLTQCTSRHLLSWLAGWSYTGSHSCPGACWERISLFIYQPFFGGGYKSRMKQASLLPDSVCVVSEWLILPFPEDLWVGNPSDATLQSHRMTLSHACVLQLLDEWRGLVHLFGWEEKRVTDSFIGSKLKYQRVFCTRVQLLFIFSLPATMSSRLKEFWPARLLAMQV